MIRFTGWFFEKSSAAVQPAGAEKHRAAEQRLASSPATAGSRRGSNQPLRAAALFFVCVCAASTASAQWTITDLGDLPGGGNVSVARGINNAGQVVGNSNAATGNRAFLWQNGVMTNLGDLPGGYGSVAYGINNAGQVAGTSEAFTGSRAFMWQNDVMTNLGVLPGHVFSSASGINDAGQVVGTSGAPTGETFFGNSSASTGQRAFLWQNGIMTNLGVLGEVPEASDYSGATGINNSGQVVVNGVDATNLRAFVWQNGVITKLGSLYISIAYGINNAGHVVGESGSATGPRAVVWQNGVMIDLGDLPGGPDFTRATDINDAGQVVGWSKNETNTDRAFLWENGVMIDLNTVSGVAGTGWVLDGAYAINDLGQIVGSGYNPEGYQHAFLLTPVPEPEAYLMMGAGVCLVGVIARRRQKISR